MNRRPVALVAVAVAMLLSVAAVGTGPALGQADTNATLDGDRFPLSADQQQVVSGETTASPGTELTVRLRSRNASTPYLNQRTAYVGETGEFAAVFDMSSVPANTSYRLTVLRNGTTLVERSGTIAPCTGDCTDSVPPMPQPPVPGTVRTVEQGQIATLPVGTNGSDTVAFSLGSRADNYLVNATLSDGNGDGEVRVRFDTAAAGTDTRTLTVADSADSLTVTRAEPALPAPLDAADYGYRVYYDGEPTDEPDAAGVLSVRANESAAFDVGADSGLGFERSIYRSRVGTVAAISVSLGDAESAAVSLGSAASGYRVNATLSDGDGDGDVRLLFDTAVAGRSGESLTAAGADTASVLPGSEVARDGAPTTGEYDLALYRGPNATGSPVDVGTLSLSPDATDEAPGTELAVTADEETGGAGGLGGGGLGALVAGGVLAVLGVGVVLRTLFA